MKQSFCLESEKYIKRIETRLAYTEVVESFSPPEGEDVVVMGSFSRTWRNKKKREVLSGRCEIVGDRSDSPIAHARDYLMTCYERRPSKKQAKLILKQKAMPIHVRPCLMEDASYVDIKGAWWNIMLSVGWNCEYNPGVWLGYGDPPIDFPLPNCKIARSSLITIARSGTIPVWREGVIHQEHIFNRIENLHIWGIVADILHMIARVAVDLFECRYVATDGFIVPTRHANDLRGFIDTLCLETRVKWSGPALIAGVGCYLSKDHSSLRSASFHELSNIDYSMDLEWLVKHYSYCNLSNKRL